MCATGKIEYRSPMTAMCSVMAARLKRKNTRRRGRLKKDQHNYDGNKPYHCARCGLWHTTSMRGEFRSPKE